MSHAEIPQGPISDEQFRIIQSMAGDLRHGSITLVFQDGCLIQIDKNEKIRIEKNKR